MTDVAIPGSPRWREEDRLAALDAYGVLDTPPESDFDDIVRIAAQICDVPMAAISLVDSGRQWFKAALGVDAAETPRDIAFCAHAIQQTDVMVVEDAAADARFKANPLVTGEMQLRFYAGAPLETPDGLPLGTLCVLDRKPRELTAAQQSALRALARQVTAQLELRKALARQSAIEADRRLLAAELEHRVKNTLAMVQAIVSQSLRIAATPAEASRTIEQRLIALARANDILIRTNWAAAPISTIVAAATDIHGAQPHRIIATGPEI
ncbi:MAG: HWE histidine kinase domain-containing protein, partial [Caulobacteraceae bacterium]